MGNYDDNVKVWKKAYQSILDACEKYPNFSAQYGFEDINTMRSAAKNHLMLIEWYEKYGLKIRHEYKPYSSGYLNPFKYASFQYFQDAEREKSNGSGRFISWPDDGRQPKEEWVFAVSFSTGAYIFGEDYNAQRQLFQDFFDELKTYKPDYMDSQNKNLYWKLENAKAIYEEFNNILKKYSDRNKSELDQRRADKLRKELAELEAKQ